MKNYAFTHSEYIKIKGSRHLLRVNAQFLTSAAVNYKFIEEKNDG
jgi:hypothetical protein